MKIKIKEIQLEVKEMRGLNKLLGLMIYKQALLFNFNKPTRIAIHSLFCPKFLAIWLDKNNKIIEYKIINSGQFKISPKKDFYKLIEIPINKRYSKILSKFASKSLIKETLK